MNRSRTRKLLRSTAAPLASVALVAGTLALAPGAQAAPAAKAAEGAKVGPSIAEVLAGDGLEFDETWKDFDILDQAVNDVLADDPESPVAVLADGDVELTAFAPTDRAFRKLVEAVAGSKPADEAAAYETLSTVGLPTIESVLLYHVVPGAPVTLRQAKKADGAELETAGGEILTVDYRKKADRVFLIDLDTDARNAYVRPWQANINKGNSQIAHGISEVLRPFDL
jgi:uncharacterized surface protein with fasciclin (FAS1) repeats